MWFLSHYEQSRLSVAVSFIFVCAAVARAPIPIKWSDKVYGPDGPWHAVRTNIGISPQQNDLYVGSPYSSWVLGPTACDGFKGIKGACAGGTYHPSFSGSAIHASNADAHHETNFVFKGNHSFFANNYKLYGEVVPVVDDITLYNEDTSEPLVVPQASVDALNYASTKTPSNKSMPLSVGFLSTGSGNSFLHFFTRLFGVVKGTQGPKWSSLYTRLFAQGDISSASFSLHVGSPSLNIKPSFTVGGYDRSRVIGPVLSQTIPVGSIPLLSLSRISIGTAYGPSPFRTKPSRNFLRHEGIESFVDAYVEFQVPYLGLPKKICEGLASVLPVSSDQSTGYYLWDTSDPQYSKIMNSSSYLEFEVGLANNRRPDSIPIKIPFALLNLTLESPITSRPTPYFPCVHSNEIAGLGRAFLQAAYISLNWAFPQPPSHWSLAQAPGPNHPRSSDLTVIERHDKTIKSGNVNWADTWAAYWSNGSTEPSPSLPGLSTSSSSLSTGVEAGIGVGTAIGIAFVMLMVYLFFKRRHNNRKVRGSNWAAELEAAKLGSPSGNWNGSPVEKEAEWQHPAKELPANTHDVYSEMSAVTKPSELSSSPVAELEGDAINRNRENTSSS